MEETLRPISRCALNGYRGSKMRTGRLTIFSDTLRGSGRRIRCSTMPAIRKNEEGRDVIIGYVNWHKRPDTVARYKVLKRSSPQIDYNGITPINLILQGNEAQARYSDRRRWHRMRPVSRHPERFQTKMNCLILA